MIGKLRYVGPDFPYSLTNGEIYDCIDIEGTGMLRIVNDDGEPGGYLYSPIDPRPLVSSDQPSKWEIVEDYYGEISELFELVKNLKLEPIEAKPIPAVERCRYYEEHPVDKDELIRKGYMVKSIDESFWPDDFSTPYYQKEGGDFTDAYYLDDNGEFVTRQEATAIQYITYCYPNELIYRSFSFKNTTITVFSFNENSGPFAYYDYFTYHINLNGDYYSCFWCVGWDNKHSHALLSLPEEHVIHFLESINNSVISGWNGFHESRREIPDAGSVSLTAKLEKCNIDIDMSGYACTPPSFTEGAEIIAKEFNNMLKKVGRSLETARMREETIYYVQRKKKTPFTNFQDSRILTDTTLQIGRGEMSDFRIDDNPQVSRQHAKICSRGGRCYIIDCNSVNKTFINGTEIPPEEEVELLPGMAISLADEELVFDSCKTYRKQLFAKRLGVQNVTKPKILMKPASIMAEINNMEKLYAIGKITDAEYGERKKDLLNAMKETGQPEQSIDFLAYRDEVIAEAIGKLETLLQMGIITQNELHAKKDELAQIDTLIGLYERKLITFEEFNTKKTDFR